MSRVLAGQKASKHGNRRDGVYGNSCPDLGLVRWERRYTLLWASDQVAVSASHLRVFWGGPFLCGSLSLDVTPSLQPTGALVLSKLPTWGFSWTVNCAPDSPSTSLTPFLSNLAKRYIASVVG